MFDSIFISTSLSVVEHLTYTRDFMTLKGKARGK